MITDKDFVQSRDLMIDFAIDAAPEDKNAQYKAEMTLGIYIPKETNGYFFLGKSGDA